MRTYKYRVPESLWNKLVDKYQEVRTKYELSIQILDHSEVLPTRINGNMDGADGQQGAAGQDNQVERNI